jgi:GNAT superfamily N-acetyltransferase
MPRLRYWQPSDLPHLQQMSIIATWEITPADDKAHTTMEQVAANAEKNLMAVLQSNFGTAIVADEDGQPVGFLLVGLQGNDKTGQPHGYMADIYVEPAFRRQGLAQAMHAAAEEYLRSIGIGKVANWTHAHNPLGQSSSLRHGFQLWGLMLSKELSSSLS